LPRTESLNRYLLFPGDSSLSVFKRKGKKKKSKLADIHREGSLQHRALQIPRLCYMNTIF
jgi:hypothetical protein